MNLIESERNNQLELNTNEKIKKTQKDQYWANIYRNFLDPASVYTGYF
jgi:hypothetical protein